MSGPMPQALVINTTALAIQAEQAASGLPWGAFARRRVEAVIAAKKGESPESGPARIWRALPEHARIAAVMFAARQEGDLDTLAKQGWEGFSANDRTAMAAYLRSLHKATADARGLY